MSIELIIRVNLLSFMYLGKPKKIEREGKIPGLQDAVFIFYVVRC